MWPRNQVFVYEDGTRSVRRTGPGAVDALCPYPGLIAFGPEQAHWFFGRDDATTQLVAEAAERLQRGGALMVIGPSGSGKSSLLRAGLVPAIARAASRGRIGALAVSRFHADGPSAR